MSEPESRRRTARWRPALHALETPTLMGRSRSSLVRAGRLDVQRMVEIAHAASSSGGDSANGVGSATLANASVHGVDVLLVDSPLGSELSRAAGEPVSGLLGYSFLQHFRVACDYPHRVLWLDPVPDFHDDRPFEHSHAGIQLERHDGLIRVMSVARPSPAQRAGIMPGDELVSIGHVQAAGATLTDLEHLMEGKPGTALSLRIRRGTRETLYRLRRARLL